MGRSKPVAKRRRLEEDEAEQTAITTLLSVPHDQVEAAAALATRESCRHWPKIHGLNGCTSSDSIDDLPDWLSGLGVATTLPKNHFEALAALHELIKNKACGWASWSGSHEDPRKRVFGFLPKTLGYNKDIRDRLDISAPWSKDDGAEERKRNNLAMVLLGSEQDVNLSPLPDGVEEAIDFLCEIFRERTKSKDFSSTLQRYLQYSNLIAAQTNLHCGRELLPSHVDHPRKDGFGVIIVTISIVGSGMIFLQDYTDQKRATMQVSQGQAYMISGKARDACHHGVVTMDGQRESLNLRFGLHDMSRGENHPLIPSNNVLQFWEVE